MDLRQLRHFQALAEYGHFGRAAASVNLTQPALSRSVQALELSLGVSLLERNSKQLRLTHYGKLVLERGNQLLRHAHGLRREVERVRGLALGELVVGASPIPGTHLVAPEIAGLLADHPGLQVRFHVQPWETLATGLRREEFDLVVDESRHIEHEADLLVTPLDENPVLVCVRAEHPLARVGRVQVSELGRYAFALSRLMPVSAQEQLAALVGQTLQISLEYDIFTSVRPILAVSDLIALTPAVAVAQDLANGLFVALTVEGLPAIAARYALVSLRARQLPPAAEALRERLLARHSPAPVMPGSDVSG